MEFKDYYAVLGIPHKASPAEIKTAYRKQARKFHPDVSKEPDAEARFKDITEANEALSDVERRAAYDAVVERREHRREPGAPPEWDGGFAFDGAGGDGDVADAADLRHSDFFEALFGRQAEGARAARNAGHRTGDDHHAKVRIDLREAYRGGRRSVSLRVPHVDAQGEVTVLTRQLDVDIPKGIRGGQHLRLAGQGAPGAGGGPAGDLYLEIEFAPTAPFRVEGRDVYIDLPVAPWEAALGANVTVPTPDGSVEMAVPNGSASGRKLRLRGQGIPGDPPGDLYAVLAVAWPKADTAAGQAAYRTMAETFGDFRPRRSLES